MYIQNLQKPYVVIKLVQNFAGLSLPPLQETFYYGIIEQINFDTINFSVGDIVLFQLNRPNPSYYDFNNEQHFLVSEGDIFYIAMSTANKIFDYTFDYTFE